MGFLSRIFGKPPAKNAGCVALDGQGSFSLLIVGESHYQENLSRICGGLTEEGVEQTTVAKLFYADDNPYDNKAIRVEIADLTVGYLGKEEARHYRERMSVRGCSGSTATCKAKVKGGWNRGQSDRGYFGVVLDLPDDFTEPENSNKFIGNNQADKPDAFTFDIDQIQKHELAQCQIGDYVNLWTLKSGACQVNVYRRGSIGGTGKIGIVPSNYASVITNHLRKGLQYETEILDIDKPNLCCKIRCRLITEEEATARLSAVRKTDADRLNDELRKPYKPKGPLLIRVQLPKMHNLMVGQVLFLETYPIEHYLRNPVPLCIHFQDSQGQVVASKSNEPGLSRSVLRASYCQCPMNFKVVSITTPDQIMLKYVEYIEAKVEVTFPPGC